MKKFSFLLAALIMAASVTGCSGEQGGVSLTTSSDAPKLSIQSSADDMPAIDTNTPSTEDDTTMVDTSTPSSDESTHTVAVKTPVTAKDLTFTQMGKVTNVFPIDAETVLVAGDKLYLYQPADGKVVAQAKSEYTVHSCTTYEDGFLLVGINMPSANGGNMMSGGGMGYFFELYDKNLKKATTISLDHVDEIEWMGDPQMAVSPDGKKLCYSTMSGLYLYDIAGKKETKLIDLGSPSQKNAGIVTISQPYFANGGKSISFLAQSIAVPVVDGQSSYSTCGVIGVDGQNLINKKPSGFSIFEQIGGYNGYALFSQDFRKPDGQVLKQDIPSGEISYLKTTTAKESGSVHGSDNGAHYASASLDGRNWTIRIYDTKTGKQLTEKTINCGDKVYTYRTPVIRMLDEQKTCIVLLGQSQKDYDTHVTVFQF